MFVISAVSNKTKIMNLNVPKIDGETLKKFPYWKQWLYNTLKEIDKEKDRC